MTYKEECMDVISRLKDSAHSKYEAASAFKILENLEKDMSGASAVSSDLLTLSNRPKVFSNKYSDFITKYDVRKIMDEGLSFGRILTVLVDIDTEKNHQVQLCEGCDKIDFGGLDLNGNYSFFRILMHYPNNAKIGNYIEGRLLSKFPSAEISRVPR